MLHTVDLVNWQDPVIKVLRNVNLSPEYRLNSPIEPRSYYYELAYQTTLCDGKITAFEPTTGSNLSELQTALVTSVKYFASFYDDETIRSAVLKLDDL
ncbi:MAG: hypothetical protein MUF87_20390 [Anaerolineae bacterium]|jgi:hypothetical protein|nr:hypothetical protein [Anaerolineae bacterium]